MIDVKVIERYLKGFLFWRRLRVADCRPISPLIHCPLNRGNRPFPVGRRSTESAGFSVFLSPCLVVQSNEQICKDILDMFCTAFGLLVMLKVRTNEPSSISCLLLDHLQSCCAKKPRPNIYASTSCEILDF